MKIRSLQELYVILYLSKDKGGWKGVITLVIKQRIILAHIDGMSNRAIANVLHLSKDTVNKYVNEYNEKREELLHMHPDMDTSEIIQAFIEKPTYDSSNRIPSKATPERAREIISVNSTL